jgi:hypothetical protein
MPVTVSELYCNSQPWTGRLEILAICGRYGVRMKGRGLGFKILCCPGAKNV